MAAPSRPEFREWVDKQPDPAWTLMPLTHICKALVGNDIARIGRIEPTDCEILGSSVAYFFYGRPAYRTSGDGPIKNPAACPMCFVFDPRLIEEATEIHPFDTGAYTARLYSHIFMDEMKREDFSLESQSRRPNRLINTVYGTREAYFDGNRAKISTTAAAPADFLAYTYIELLRSTSRNEPDDRVGTIEIVCGESVPLAGNLLATVVPDIIWNDQDKSEWLSKLQALNVTILPFRYLHGRDPEHHHAMIEIEIRNFYESRGDI